MQQPAETAEDVLAELIENGEVIIGPCHVRVGGYPLAAGDRAIIAKALRDRARWMAVDIYSGEKGKRRAR